MRGLSSSWVSSTGSLGVCCTVNGRKVKMLCQACQAFRYSFKFRTSSFSVLTKTGQITGYSLY